MALQIPKYENEKCLWCGSIIDRFANNRTRIKRVRACRYGKCSSYLAFYENSIRQLNAYLKTMDEHDRNEVTKLLLAFATTNYSTVELGQGKLQYIRHAILQTA